MACRSESRGKEAVKRLREEALEKPVKEGVALLEGLDDVDVSLELLDLASLQSVIDFAQRFRASGDKIDALINNAGVVTAERKETVDGYEMQIGVNHFGPHLLSRLMEPCLKDDGGRLIFLSSSAHANAVGQVIQVDWDNMNFEKPGSYECFLAYGRSKLGNILDAKEFAKRLAPRRITTYAVHPGGVDTELQRSLSEEVKADLLARYTWAGPLQGSLTTLKCATDPSLGKAEVSGRYWADLQAKIPSKVASDPALPAKFWKATEDALEAKLGKKLSELIPT